MDYGDEPFPHNHQVDAWMREAERLKKQIDELRALLDRWKTDAEGLRSDAAAGSTARYDERARQAAQLETCRSSVLAIIGKA